MNRLSRCVLMVVVTAAASAGVTWAQQGLDTRVSVDVDAAPAREVFASIARALNGSIRINPASATPPPVTLQVRNVRARLALDAICDSIGCQWRFDGRDLVVDLRPAPVAPSTRPPFDAQAARVRLMRRLPPNLQFTGVTLREALAKIAEVGGTAIEIDGGDADQRVSVDVSNLPFVEAVKKVIEGTRLDGRVIMGVIGPTSTRVILRAVR